MEAIQNKILGILMVFFCVGSLKAQEEKFNYVTVTTMHVKMDNENGSFEEWQALEKEFFDKVTSKNEFILSHNNLAHYFTEDNSEVINVNVYEDWSKIEAAQKRNNELIDLAWPDKAKRDAFFKKRNSYYEDTHSDEIYVTMPYNKVLAAPKASDKQLVYYVRRGHFNLSFEGSDEEFDKLFKEYFDAVTMKNEHIIAYYTLAHAWGSDKTDFIEVYVVENLDGIEKSFQKNDELFNAHWKDEKKRKEYNTKLNKYFTPLHADYLYRSIVGLRK